MSVAAAIPAPAVSRPGRLRWAVLAIVLVAEVMDLVDGTIVNVAAPSIRADLGGTATTLQWLGAAYTLAFAVLLVTGGRARRPLRAPPPCPVRPPRVSPPPAPRARAARPRRAVLALPARR